MLRHQITEPTARRQGIIRVVAAAMLISIFSLPASAQIKRKEKFKPKKRICFVLTSMSLAAAATAIHNSIQARADGATGESDPFIRPFRNLPAPAYATSLTPERFPVA